MNDIIWIIVGLLYLGVAVYLFYQRYILHPRERFEGMIAFSDMQTNVSIVIWPITFLLLVLFVVAARYSEWRGKRQMRNDSNG